MILFSNLLPYYFTKYGKHKYFMKMIASVVVVLNQFKIRRAIKVR